MKNEKGLTLISVIIYVIVMLIVVVIVGSMNMFFYNNVVSMKENADLNSEHNKFNIAFLQDVKEYGVTANVNSSEEDFITFSNEVLYIKEGDKIYRNHVKICEFVDSAKFRLKEENGKQIVEVFIVFKNNTNEFSKRTEYVVGIGY